MSALSPRLLAAGGCCYVSALYSPAAQLWASACWLFQDHMTVAASKGGLLPRQDSAVVSTGLLPFVTFTTCPHKNVVEFRHIKYRSYTIKCKWLSVLLYLSAFVTIVPLFPCIPTNKVQRVLRILEWTGNNIKEMGGGEGVLNRMCPWH